MNFQHLLFPCLGRLPAGRVFLAAALSVSGVQAYAAGADVTAVADVTDVQGDTAASSALPEVIVTGNPLGAAQIIAPASVLSGENLLLQRASTLGATLQALPGVGRKTANVIQSVVFNKAAMAVDTHVFRVSHRIGLVPQTCTTPLATEKYLMKYIPKEIVPTAHHWLILHGRYVCMARTPKCSECGLNGLCRYSLKPAL